MLLFTKLLSFIHFLALVWLCFLQCVITIEEDKFTFWKTISKNEEGNVYKKCSLPFKRNHVLTCSSKCVRSKDCVGIDICDGRICRLWNGTYYQGISMNNSNELCQRYIKVSMLSTVHQFNLNGVDTSSNQALTSPTNDQSSMSDRTTNTMPSETDILSTDLTSMYDTSLAVADTTTGNAHTTQILSQINQSTNTVETSGPFDSTTTDSLTTVTPAPIDSTSSDVMTTKKSNQTDITTADITTTKTEISGPTDSTKTDVLTTVTSPHTNSTTTDTMTTLTSSPTGGTSKDAMTTKTTGSIDSTGTDVMTTVTSATTYNLTKTSGSTDRINTDEMTTVTSAPTFSTTKDTMTTKTSSPSDSTTTDVITTENLSDTETTPTYNMTTETLSETDNTTTYNMTTKNSGLTDSTKSNAMTTGLSDDTDSTVKDTMTTLTSGPTDSTATVTMTIETLSDNDNTKTDAITTVASSHIASTSTGVITFETSSDTDSSTTDTISTKNSGPTDSTTTDVMTTETTGPTDSTTSDVKTTVTSAPDSTVTDVMITETSSSTKETSTETTNIFLPTTDTTNTNISPANIQATQPSTHKFDSETTNDILATEETTSKDSLTELNLSTKKITTESSDQSCMVTHEFSGGNYEVPCFNDTYSWIVIQRRHDGSVNFNKNWNEYEFGFGSMNSEFWLGNRYIHELTSVFGYNRLRIEIKRFDGREGYAEYTFSIDDAASQYMIHIAWELGNIEDSFWLTDGALFCTLDQDNDGNNGKVCTSEYHGGWWYAWAAYCTEANLNGIYYPMEKIDKTGIFWYYYDSSNFGYDTLKEVRMMIRTP